MTALSMAWGSTYAFTITVTQNGAPLNLTGKTLKFMVKYRFEDDDSKALISLSTSAGIVLTDPTNGIATATIGPSATAGLDPGINYNLEQDVRLIDGSNVYTVEGPDTFTITRVVVRATS